MSAFTHDEILSALYLVNIWQTWGLKKLNEWMDLGSISENLFLFFSTPYSPKWLYKKKNPKQTKQKPQNFILHMRWLRFREVKEFLQPHSTQKLGLGLCCLKVWDSLLLYRFDPSSPAGWIYAHRNTGFPLLVTKRSRGIGSAYISFTIHLCPLDLARIWGMPPYQFLCTFLFFPSVFYSDSAVFITCFPFQCI